MTDFDSSNDEHERPGAVDGGPGTDDARSAEADDDPDVEAHAGWGSAG